MSGGIVGGSGWTVRVRWTEVSGIDNYIIYRSNVSGSSYVEIGESSGDTYYDSITLSNAGVYYYVVTAVDSQGIESAYSNQAVVGVGIDV